MAALEKMDGQLQAQDEARCPVCSEALVEPVTMPCAHAVCLPCLRQTLRCPLCRRRVCGWARRRSRQCGAVMKAQLWEKLEPREGEACGGEEMIFKRPVRICKSGEMHRGYEKKTVTEDKPQQVTTPVGEAKEIDQNPTTVKNDMNLLKPKTGVSDDKRVKQPREDRCGPLKHLQDSLCGVLSDTENKEPVGRRTRHLSAFVRKSRSSPASSRIFRNRVVQRSRSCTDTEEEKGKNTCLYNLNALAKACIGYSHNAGILLSSENSRSLSAPVLTPDKRRTCRGPAPPFSKPERSISPESNDSISEELNHFKPIVCSPCTPPKRLPDGRILEPTIVKSTPRNLSRSLQKPTSYEASPTILQKWKQIEVDRRAVEVASKGTVTSPICDVNLAHDRKRPTVEDSPDKNLIKERANYLSERNDTSGIKDLNIWCNKRQLTFDQPHKESGGYLDRTGNTSSQPSTRSKYVWRQKMDTNARPEEEAAASSQSQVDRQKHSPVCRVQSRPTTRKGRKRIKKSKHLEDPAEVKKPRPTSRDPFTVDASCIVPIYSILQEDEDRKLALKLQRHFNRECERLDRQRTSEEKYLLRSWVSSDRNFESAPRRSGRLSKKCERF